MAASTEEEAERLYMASFIKFRRGSGYIHRIPPTRILMFPEIFEVAWGWERILPKDFCSMPLYLDYLKEYHSKNRMACVTAADVTSKPEHSPHEVRPVDDVTQCHRNGKDDLIAAARSCLDMEKQFMSKWNNQPVHNVKLLSERIQERACYLIHMEQEFSEPAAASLLCITNEATLALELLRYGAKSTDKEFILCNYIRQCALSLMYIEGPHSDASTAAMVGVAKEAKKIREWMVANKELYLFGSYALYHEMGLCDLVRTSTFGVMKHILSNYTGNSEPFAVMNFREIMTDSKVQKTMSGTSDKSLSQIEQKQLIGQKNILELNDDDGASDALMINND
ncbi:uncharacterized protein [Lolium perenne]|uniref:uncharacterized protein isoform X2 n=1 Tax=Lolium perenne TaxID=4522 RepID=UPI0021F5442A|nr:uncharacterized protein LOC127300906 isoform X3 [Lolium perenne]